MRSRSAIKIPEKLTKIRIDKLYHFGKISEEEKAKLIKSFPKTKIYFNSTEEIDFRSLQFVDLNDVSPFKMSDKGIGSFRAS